MRILSPGHRALLSLTNDTKQDVRANAVGEVSLGPVSYQHVPLTIAPSYIRRTGSERGAGVQDVRDLGCQFNGLRHELKPEGDYAGSRYRRVVAVVKVSLRRSILVKIRSRSFVTMDLSARCYY